MATRVSRLFDKGNTLASTLMPPDMVSPNSSVDIRDVETPSPPPSIMDDDGMTSIHQHLEHTRHVHYSEPTFGPSKSAFRDHGNSADSDDQHDPQRFLADSEPHEYFESDLPELDDDEDPPESLLMERDASPRRGWSRLLGGARIPARNQGYVALEVPSERFPVANGRVLGRDAAVRTWDNVEDLDRFLARVYTYFVGKGIWTMLVERICNLLYVIVECADVLAFSRLW